MAPESNNKKNKSDQVAEAILEKIASGEWPTDCKMPTEKELSESFGVSRVSVRQAISQLTGQGVLWVVQGGGTYVNKVLPKDYLNNVLQMVVMDDPDYLEIQEFRLLLEPMIAHYTAAKATPEAIDEMRQCIERQRRRLRERTRSTQTVRARPLRHRRSAMNHSRAARPAPGHRQ